MARRIDEPTEMACNISHYIYKQEQEILKKMRNCDKETKSKLTKLVDSLRRSADDIRRNCIY